MLCIGDVHVPHRTTDLPAKFKSLLVPGKIHHILSTGNLCTRVRLRQDPRTGLISCLSESNAARLQEIFDYLKSVCGDLHVVKGEFDEPNTYPEEEVSSRTNIHCPSPGEACDTSMHRCSQWASGE